MGSEGFPHDIPKSREEVAERQREMDEVRIMNSLKWINKMRETPPDKVTADDIFTIEQLSYYINEMYEYEDNRPREMKQYPYIDENTRAYLREQANHHRGFLIRSNARKKRAKVAKTSTSVVCILIVAMFAAQGISSFAFGYDLFGNIADWGKTVLRIPSGTPVSQGDITVTKNDKTTTYININEAIDGLEVDILVPNYLPDNVSINKIYMTEDRIDNNIYTLIWLLFDDDNYKMWISSNQNDYNPDVGELTTIGRYKCKIDYFEDSYQIDFIESNYLYSIKGSDYDILVKIIENLK